MSDKNYSGIVGNRSKEAIHVAADAQQEESKDDELWYVSPAQAAKKTGLAQTTIHYALHSGALRGFRVGRRWLIAPEDIHTWIRSNPEVEGQSGSEIETD
ncbi:MAG: helix-turn-helix domain-containing protein [Thermomicrobiales bacterium]